MIIIIIDVLTSTSIYHGFISIQFCWKKNVNMIIELIN